MTASLTLLRLVGPKALPRVDLVGSDVQPGQIKKVLSYLTNRDAYSPDLIELSVLSAFMAVRGAKLVQRVSKKIPTAKMVRERLRKAERVLRMIEQVKGDLDGNLSCRHFPFRRYAGSVRKLRGVRVRSPCPGRAASGIWEGRRRSRKRTTY